MLEGNRRGLEIGFVNIWVEDVGRSVAFYERLGLHKRFHIDTKYGGYAEFGTELGGAGADAGSVRLCICHRRELHELLGKQNAGREGHGIHISVMLVHDDVEGAYKHAVGAGGESVTAPGPVGCWKQTTARVLDPDGNLITLLARITPKEQATQLFEIGGSVALEALKKPEQAAHLKLDSLPVKAADLAASRSELQSFINQISDEHLARIFAAGGMAGMENAMLERIRVE